jgi:SnoaL-like domain
MHASRLAVCATFLLLAGCITGEPRLSDREAIADTLSRANMGFEISDPDLFADAFALDGIYQLDEKGPVFGYDKMVYKGRDQPSG